MPSPSTYSDFQGLSASEKIGLVVLEAAKRLMGWVVHSGSIYKLTSFDHPVIVSIADSGVAVTSVTSLASVTAGTFYFDRANRVLYLQTSDSVNPNGKFLSMTCRYFFANVGITAPNDLASGFEVEWLPLFVGTSLFSVALDNQYQLGMAIEGSGTVEFQNDQDFWIPLFDKMYFENKLCLIYSWTRELPISEAKLIYRGRVQKKTYTTAKVSFTLKDLMNELRQTVPLTDLSAIVGARIPDSLATAKQRLLYGYVFGHQPVNVDQELSGYPLTGTFSVTSGSNALTGSGTQFLAQLTPNDELTIGSDSVKYTIDQVLSDTSATFTENYAGVNQAGASAGIHPSHPKRYMNRNWVVAGHALREPVTTVTSAKSTGFIQLASVSDLLPGDELVIGSELTGIAYISGSWIKLTNNLLTVPAAGTSVKRSAITDVYLNDRKLEVTRDYTYSASTGTFALDPLAEFNVAPIRKVTGTVAFTNTSRSITGTGTIFTKELNPGDWIRGQGQGQFFEVLSVDADGAATLRTPATYTISGTATYKSPEVYNEGSVVLSCDVLGKADDGTTTGNLIKTAPQAVKDLLALAGLSSYVAGSSFTDAQAMAYQPIGLAIPTNYSDQTSPVIRDVISAINQSVFGSLVQNEDFLLEYSVLRPRKSSTGFVLRKEDILSFTVDSNSDRIVKTATVKYLNREYDIVAAGPTYQTASKVSDNAQYLAENSNEVIKDSYLVNETDAQIMANRWAFILEVSSSIVKVNTKLIASRLQITDQVEVEHEKIYERIGSSFSRKIAGIQGISKNQEEVTLELEDLANAFSRCGSITDAGAPNYSNGSEKQRMYQGFVTDSYGMMANDPETFGVNLIW